MRRLSCLKKPLLIIMIVTLSMAPFAPLSLVPEAQAASFKIQTGYYMGKGTAGTAITGLGFTPDTVIIKSSTTAGVMVFKTSAMPSSEIGYASATANNTASSIQFTSGGFTLGTLANVNSANVLYYWTAFTGSDCSTTGNYCVGVYTGNGTNPRTITTGFQPAFVMLKRSTAVEGHFRVGSQPANETLFFGTTARDTAGNYLQSFSSTGFVVGATDNANGGLYYYVAFKSGSGAVSQGSYTGDGTDNRNITGPDFLPDLVLVKNATSATAASRNTLMNNTDAFGDSSSYAGAATANLVNAVQALQSGGFQVGSAAQTNESSATFYWVAFGGAVDPTTTSGNFSMATGSYTGTGASLSIGDVGFAPDLVIIKDNAANFSVFRTTQMAGDSTAHMASGTANFTGGITALGSDGFTVGTNAMTNMSGNTYQWQAFGNAFNPYTSTGAADFAVGTFYGNGIDNRTISRLPFQPDFLTIKRNSTSAASWRTSNMAGDLSTFFGATAETNNHIQSFTEAGFTVGTNAVVNSAGSLHYWFAFKTGSNFAVGTYSGTSSAQTILTPGFQPELAWVKRSTAVNGVMKPASLSGNNTQYFAATANISDRITALAPQGFLLGGAQTETNTSGGTYRYAAWRSSSTGALTADIVNANGISVGAPTFSMTTVGSSFINCGNTTGTLGSSSQRIRVTNTTLSAPWSVSIAATDGQAARWHDTSNTFFFDYNDGGGSPAGCSDSGVDDDTVAGRLTVSPAAATIVPQSGCSGTGVTSGSNTSFAEGGGSSVVLASASSGASTSCHWDITNIGLGQTIPVETVPGSYSLEMTVTVIAN